MSNQYIQQLTRITTPVGSYLIPISDDPSGASTLKAITLTNLMTLASGTSGGNAVISVAGRSGAVTLANTDISGLGTASILNSGNFFQISNQLLDGNAATMRTNLGLGVVATWGSGQVFFNSPLSGIPTAPTAALNTDTTQIATTAFVNNAINNSGVTTTSTQTLINKRITKRVINTTQSATPSINTDITDRASITGLAQNITSFSTNLTGTPINGDMLIIDIIDNGTARTLTWGSNFESSNVTLPTITVISTRLDVGFVWNSVTSKWRCIATA
jgi:hypothetical protein